MRKSRPVSIAVTGVSKDGEKLEEITEKPLSQSIYSLEKPPVAPSSAHKSTIKRTPSSASSKTETPKNRPSSAKATPKASNTPLLSPTVECAPKIEDDTSKSEKTIINNVIKAEQQHTEQNLNGTVVDAPEIVEVVEKTIEAAQKIVEEVQKVEQPQELANPLESVDMTSSMMAKSRINTEEEAKAAIAERRRLAREEAERQAELERKRQEEEEKAELVRQQEEEERQRKFETETIRLAEEQRKLEDERLQQAIEENTKREEEEKLRKEEEARQKIERDVAEKKAKEEAEKAKAEAVERLIKEEKEREERRKRVEAIMARTRKGGAPNGNSNTPSKVNRQTI